MPDRRGPAVVGVFATVLIFQHVTLTTPTPISNYEALQTSPTDADSHTSLQNSTVSYSSSTYFSSSRDYSYNSTFQSSYIVVAPSFVRANMIFNIGINLPKALGACDAIAVIKTDTELVAGGRGTFTSTQSGLLRVRIPDKLPNSYFFYLNVKVNGSIDFDATYTLLHQTQTISLFVQTDKPVYKAGDKVQFRAFALFPNYKVYQDLLDVTIYDPDSNQVEQWLNDTHQLDGLVSGEFLLPPRPQLGKWKIKVDAQGQSKMMSFMVREYEKPLFEVIVTMPPYALQAQQSVLFFIQAKFPSGKFVMGKVDVIAKLVEPRMTDEEIHNTTAFIETEIPFIHGFSQYQISMAEMFRVKGDLNNQTLFVKVKVTESMTGKTQETNSSVDVLLIGEALSFPVINAQRFKPSLDYTVYLKLTYPDGSPMVRINGAGVHVTTTLQILDVDGPPPFLDTTQMAEYPLTTEKHFDSFFTTLPVDGMIEFPLVPKRKAITMEIKAEYGRASASFKVYASYSPSYSFIQLYLAHMRSYGVGDTMEFVIKATERLEYFTYQVLSKGVLLHTERRFGYRTNTTKLFVDATVAMIPTARIVVFYTRTDGEVVADSYTVDIEGNFPNEVQLTMDEDVVPPNKQIATYVVGDGGGRVYLHAIDQRVYYKNSPSEITRQEVYSGLNQFDPMWHSGTGRRAMKYARYAVSTSAKDAYSTFWGSGLIVMTDHLFYNYLSPYEGRVSEPYKGTTEDGLVEDHGWFPYNQVGKVLTHFPESWLWTDIEVCANGEAIYFVEVPEVSTTWLINGFAINKDTGFGMPIGPYNLQVFKAFYTIANFPTYDIILGEEVALEIIIFNYMNSDQTILVTLPKHYAYTSAYRDCNGVDYHIQQDQKMTVVVKSGKPLSIYFPIIPLILGAIDVQVKIQSAWMFESEYKPIKVVAPGSAMDFNIPVYIDLTGEEREFHHTFNIDLPNDVIKDSRFMKVSAFGDFLGPSIVGMSSLLDIPVGCGEQTLLSMATDLYITEYLRYTKQLSQNIKEEAYALMRTGYQQELTFKHDDGSFSAFGIRDESGSMWLTAFVARVFHKASNHIFIETHVIRNAIDWMVSHQNHDGSFPEPGRVIDKHVKGNSGTGPSLSAFVFLSLLENVDLYDESTENGNAQAKVPYGAYAKGPTTPSVCGNITNCLFAGAAFFAAKRKCLAYLEMAAARETDLYFLSMAAFALQVAGSNETDALLDRLMAKAVRRDHFVYWHHPDSQPASIGTWHRPNPSTAVDVEMTSYLLATVALREDVHLGRKIFYWLLGQRNTHGGFYSTQDTVVAFMAMGLFAELVYYDDVDMTTRIFLDTGEAYRFHITRHNALTHQRRETNKIPLHVTVEAAGRGLAVVEISLYFNIELDVEDTNFDLNVTLLTETKNSINMEVCASWRGEGNASGMAVMEIGIPTGFEPDKKSVPDLSVLKMVEVENSKLVLYFDEISLDPVCITVRMDRIGLVGKNKPAVVKIYDYYEPTHHVTHFYQPKTLARLGICDVCRMCHNCMEKKTDSEEHQTAPMDEDNAIEDEISAD